MNLSRLNACKVHLSDVHCPAGDGQWTSLSGFYCRRPLGSTLPVRHQPIWQTAGFDTLSILGSEGSICSTVLRVTLHFRKGQSVDSSVASYQRPLNRALLSESRASVVTHRPVRLKWSSRMYCMYHSIRNIYSLKQMDRNTLHTSLGSGGPSPASSRRSNIRTLGDK